MYEDLNPVKKIIDELFEDDFMGEGRIPVKDVNLYVKLSSILKYKNGEIPKEHKRPSTKKIKNTMEKSGYKQKSTTITKDGERIRARCYLDIRTTPLLHSILGDMP